MGAPRKLAAGLLRAVLRLAPSESSGWAYAMLRELDFIESDWAALFWALGSTAALLRHAANGWGARLRSKLQKEADMNSTGKKAMGVGLGAFSALMLAGCAFAILRIAAILFPGLHLEHSDWAFWLVVIIVPEAIFVAAAVMLWRKRGPVAAGILTLGLVLALHLGVHLATR
jgi:hypothetical protein